MERLEDLTGHEVLCDIPSVEPIGPKGLLDVLVIAPATGNTIAKLAAASRIRPSPWLPRPTCGTGGRW